VTYDTFRQECVVFGEETGVVDGHETPALYPQPDGLRFIWRCNDAQWQADPPTPTLGVSANQFHTMAFDSDRNALVLFGGSNEKGDYNTNYTYEIVYKDAPTVLKQPALQKESEREARIVSRSAPRPVIAHVPAVRSLENELNDIDDDEDDDIDDEDDEDDVKVKAAAKVVADKAAADKAAADKAAAEPKVEPAAEPEAKKAEPDDEGWSET